MGLGRGFEGPKGGFGRDNLARSRKAPDCQVEPVLRWSQVVTSQRIEYKFGGDHRITCVCPICQMRSGEHSSRCICPICIKPSGEHYSHCICPICQRRGGEHYSHCTCPVCQMRG